MRFGFVTCVQLGLACMEAIYAAGGKLDLAITLTDDKAQSKSGRVFIDDFCAENGIDLVKVRHINDEDAIKAIKDRGIDWLFIIGWSQIAGQAVLNAPNRGVLGIHPTLLPEGRGRAPIPNAILKGLTQTGVTLFKLDVGVDTGEILAQEVLPIADDETATTLYKRVNEAHKTIIHNVWPSLVNDTLELKTQDGSRATIWEGRTPDDGRITWGMTVEQVDRLVRATTRPYPGAFVKKEDGSVLRIWSGRISDIDHTIADRSELVELSNGIYEALDFERE
ncbi:MAG TPA: formyltransferase family protein [Pyrinomonadaceae bacterium]|nr:formyltransferase family protein [Pyrinomonadaceae bacterium]